LDACAEHAAEALAIARRFGGDALELFAGAARLLAALGGGSVQEAVAAGEAVAQFFEERGYAEPGIAHWHGDLIEAYTRDGRNAEARELLERLTALARSTEGPWALGVAARCRGLLADDLTFEHDFAEALRQHGRAALPFDWARTQLCLGERRRRVGRRVDARQPLRSALDTFEALGARPWAQRARAELRACGGKATEPRSAPTEALTPHELRVALIVARGATNRDAAAALFVSPKTID